MTLLQKDLSQRIKNVDSTRHRTSWSTKFRSVVILE